MIDKQKMMSGAEIIAKTLKSIGVKKVFLFPGGTIAPLLDSLVKVGIKYVCTRNEQGAGYAAIGAAKTTGLTQVVIVTSGPGVTNVLTPVADAYYDSVPLLVLTGQVGTRDINFEKKVRQTGFSLMEVFRTFAQKYQQKIINVRGRGFMIGVELRKGYKAADVVKAMYEKGVLIGTAGPQVVRFLPPFIVTDEEMAKTLKKFEQVIKKM